MPGYAISIKPTYMCLPLPGMKLVGRAVFFIVRVMAAVHTIRSTRSSRGQPPLLSTERLLGIHNLLYMEFLNGGYGYICGLSASA